MYYLKRCFYRIYAHMEAVTEKDSRQIVTFGLLMAVNYPLYQIIWYFASTSGYHNFPLRLTATAACLLLVSSPYWSPRAKKILPIFWYFSLCLCLPFFFTYMTLRNDLATLWLMNSMSSLFFMFLLVDFLSAIVLILIGTTIGIVLFQLTSQTVHYIPGVVTLDGLMATYIPAIIIGGIFSRNNEIVLQEKFDALQTMSASVAHELRTPLAAIKFATVGLSKYLPTILQGYKVAKEHSHGDEIKEIRRHYLQLLEDLPERISKLLYQANMSIDMMLMNANQLKISDSVFEDVSVMCCLQEALQRYPFKSQQQANLVTIEDPSQDFVLRGSELLLLHVFYNLIKNSLYFIEGQRRGEIIISTVIQENYNILYFKDTAKGIPSSMLKKLFKQFQSKREGGTGVGLSFCKMVMEAFGGEINCHSTEGIHTTFILTFPSLA